MKAASSRAYSTKYEDHIGLIRKLALRGWGRLTEANVHVDFDDVVQDMTLTYVKAADKYNPDHGVTFSAYLGRAIWNQFNKFAEKEIRVQADLKLVRFEQLGDAVEDSDDGSVYESIASDEWTPEQYVEAAQQFRENMKSLGPTAKFIVSKLLNPTNDLMEALELAKRNAELARKSGQYAKAPNDVTIAFIASHYGLDEKNVKKARKTLFSMYGLTKGTRG